MYSSEQPANGLSEAAAEMLQQMFRSNASEQIAVADCLNSIAENGDGQETDEHLIACADEIVGAARAFQRRVRGLSETLFADPYQHLIDTAYVAADEMQEVHNNWEEGDLAVAVNGMDVDGLRQAAAALEKQLIENVRNRGGHIELHDFPKRAPSFYDRAFIAGAKKMCDEGTLEVDDRSFTSKSDDAGEYVMAWIWVPNENAKLRVRHKAHVYYQTGPQEAKHLLATCEVLAFDREEAKALMLDQCWEPRLDSAGCAPILEWVDVPLSTFEIEVRDRGLGLDSEVIETIDVEAAEAEDAIAALEVIYPATAYRMTWYGFTTINHYECSKCHKAWHDRWSGPITDACPKCGTVVEPYASEED